MRTAEGRTWYFRRSLASEILDAHKLYIKKCAVDMKSRKNIVVTMVKQGKACENYYFLLSQMI